MRDEIDGRLWVAHHDQFSAWIDGAAATARARLRGLAPGLSEAPRLALLMAAVLGLTLLGFTATVA